MFHIPQRVDKSVIYRLAEPDPIIANLARLAWLRETIEWSLYRQASYSTVFSSTASKYSINIYKVQHYCAHTMYMLIFNETFAIQAIHAYLVWVTIKYEVVFSKPNPRDVPVFEIFLFARVHAGLKRQARTVYYMHVYR